MSNRTNGKQPQPIPLPTTGERVWHPDNGNGTVLEPYGNGFSHVHFDNGAQYTSGNFNLYPAR